MSTTYTAYFEALQSKNFPWKWTANAQQQKNEQQKRSTANVLTGYVVNSKCFNCKSDKMHLWQTANVQMQLYSPAEVETANEATAKVANWKNLNSIQQNSKSGPANVELQFRKRQIYRHLQPVMLTFGQQQQQCWKRNWCQGLYSFWTYVSNALVWTT